MKFWSIVKALEEGNSVRNIHWSKHLTLSMTDGRIVDTEGFTMSLDTIFNSIRSGKKWEII